MHAFDDGTAKQNNPIESVVSRVGNKTKPSEKFQAALNMKPKERVHARACTLHVDFRFHAGYGLLKILCRMAVAGSQSG